MGTYSDFKSKMKDASNTKKRPNKDRNDKSSNAGERSMTENDKKYIKGKLYIYMLLLLLL